jgi:excisionase family DNA binding protein
VRNVSEHDDFAELMRRSSLGSAAARRTLERVPLDRADTVRRIGELRTAINRGGPSSAAGLEATRELVGLLRSRGLAWRDEIPDDVVLGALNNALMPGGPDLPDKAVSAEEGKEREVDALVNRLNPRAAQVLRLYFDGLTMSQISEQLHVTSEAVSSTIRAGLMGMIMTLAKDEQARRPPEEPVSPGPTPRRPRGNLQEAVFLTVAEAASVMRVSKMTVYRLVNSGHLPAIRVGRSFRVPEQAVHEYLRESVENRIATDS